MAVLLTTLVLLAASCSSESTESSQDGGSEASPAADTDTEGNDGASPEGEPIQEESGEGESGEGAAAVPSPGCDGGSGGSVVSERQSFDIDGSARWYLVTAPEAATGSDPVPLVLDFHGLSEGAEFHSQATGYDELAESEGFVVVYPHGTGQPVSWNISSNEDNPDLAYVDEVLRQVEQAWCIDTSRVYATGLSNGAFMSSTLACVRAGTFAAVAPVAGVARAEDCAPARAVPVITFHGTQDPLLPFNGTVSVGAISGITEGAGVSTTTSPPADIDGAGYPASAAAWADSNGCGEPADEQVTDSVLLREWDCPEGAEVAFYVIDGGGHTWPGSDALTNEGIAAIVGPTNMEIDATALSWEFFRNHRLPA